MKKVVVAGAYGFIGRYVAKEYKKNGYYVIGLGHGDWVMDESSQWGLDEWHSCDIVPDMLRKYAMSADVFVNCAGSGSVWQSIKEPYLDFGRTVLTSLHILDHMRQYVPKAKFIYPSSAAVYGEVSNSEVPVCEEDAGLPISPYGWYKLITENLCQGYSQQYGICTVVLRLFSVYGEGLEKQLLWDACNKLSSGNRTFFGTGEETRDFMHVSDVAKYMCEAADRFSEGFSVTNVGSGQYVSVKQLLSLLKETMRVDGDIIFDDCDHQGNPHHLNGNVDKIRDWTTKPQISLSEGIERYVKWYREKSN